MSFSFQGLAPYLKDPLVLIGFFLLVAFLFSRSLVKRGIIVPLTKALGYRILKLILLYGFIIGLLIIILGFILKRQELIGRSQAASAIESMLREALKNVPSVSAEKKDEIIKQVIEEYQNGILSEEQIEQGVAEIKISLRSNPSPAPSSKLSSPPPNLESDNATKTNSPVSSPIVIETKKDTENQSDVNSSSPLTNEIGSRVGVLVRSARWQCLYSGVKNAAEKCSQERGSVSENQAVTAIQKILSYSGLGAQMNFFLKPCSDLQNVVATFDDSGLRLILYDLKYLEDENKKTSSEWTSLGILAHQVGHHVYGHPSASTQTDHQKGDELAADYFSGYTLCRMKARLEDAQAYIRDLSDVFNKNSSGYPTNMMRLEAVKHGFEACQSQTSKQKANLYTYYIYGWIESGYRGNRIAIDQVAFHKDKFSFVEGSFLDFDLTVVQFTNGKRCNSGRIHPGGLTFPVGSTVSDKGEARPLFAGGVQVENGHFLVLYLNPGLQCTM